MQQQQTTIFEVNKDVNIRLYATLITTFLGLLFFIVVF